MNDIDNPLPGGNIVGPPPAIPKSREAPKVPRPESQPRNEPPSKPIVDPHSQPTRD